MENGWRRVRGAAWGQGNGRKRGEEQRKAQVVEAIQGD